MECRVEFDYAAQEADELSLKKGDVITNVVQKMDGWWEGVLAGKKGMFPDNFVKIISPSLNSSTNSGSGESLNNTKEEVKMRKTSLNRNRRLKALFSYAPEQDDELQLEVGDVVDFIAEVEEGWWRGKLKGRVGIFPSNFVKEHEPTTNGNAQESGYAGKIEELKNNDKPRIIGKGVPDIVKSDRTSVNIDDEPAPELPPKPVREIAKCFYPYQALNEDELTLTEGDIVTIISKTCEDEGWWRGELRGKNGLFPDNFVRIISPNDPVISSSNISSLQPQQKILAQGRNIPSPGVEPGTLPKEVASPTPAISVTDGVASSKTLEKEKSFDGKFKYSRPKVKEAAPPPPVERPPPPKPPILTPPVSPAVTVQPPGVMRHESKKEPTGENLEEMEFNAVERTEKLSHLTATRAKAPKRRPPSTIITRDNDINVMNGSVHSQEHILDSPPAGHSTPFNLSHNTSNGTANNLTNSVNSTPSNSVHDGPSLSNSSSILSPKEASMNSNTSVGGTAAAAKPKMILPWMAELKQNQDRKKGVSGSPNNVITNANTSTNSNTSNLSSNTSLPSPTQLTTPQPSPTPSPIVTTPSTKDREPAPLPGGIVITRAPPLPAKPSTLIQQISDKCSAISPGTTSAPVPLAKKFGTGKKPSAEIIPGPGTNIYSNSNSVNDVHGETNSKPYVSYEEHAKLRDRVSSLENELETVKRQLKILIDRDLHQGHIV